MSINSIYTFEINKKFEQEKTWEVQEENGEKVTRTKKEIVTKPIKFILSKPKRKDINRCDQQNKISLGKFIRNQYITRAELKHQYEKFGIEKEFGEKWVESIKEFSEITQKLKTETGDQESLKARLEELEKTIGAIESRYREIFDSTAEAAAEIDTVLCLMSFCTYIQEGDKLEVYFKGDSFDKKMEYMDNLDDSEDEIFQMVYNRILTLWTAWFYGNKDEKSLAEVDNRILGNSKQNEEKDNEIEENQKEEKVE